MLIVSWQMLMSLKYHQLLISQDHQQLIPLLLISQIHGRLLIPLLLVSQNRHMLLISQCQLTGQRAAGCGPGSNQQQLIGQLLMFLNRLMRQIVMIFLNRCSPGGWVLRRGWRRRRRFPLTGKPWTDNLRLYDC